ncbi:hypothetical protein [Kitasatospora sp. NPDC090091]
MTAHTARTSPDTIWGAAPTDSVWGVVPDASWGVTDDSGWN